MVHSSSSPRTHSPHSHTMQLSTNHHYNPIISSLYVVLSQWGAHYWLTTKFWAFYWGCGGDWLITVVAGWTVSAWWAWAVKCEPSTILHEDGDQYKYLHFNTGLHEALSHHSQLGLPPCQACRDTLRLCLSIWHPARLFGVHGSACSTWRPAWLCGVHGSACSTWWPDCTLNQVCRVNTYFTQTPGNRFRHTL